MGRFYAELSVTIYADTEDEAAKIAEEVRAALDDATGGMDGVGGAEVVDVEADPMNGEEG